MYKQENRILLIFLQLLSLADHIQEDNFEIALIALEFIAGILVNLWLHVTIVNISHRKILLVVIWALFIGP